MRLDALEVMPNLSWVMWHIIQVKRLRQQRPDVKIKKQKLDSINLNS